MTVVLTGDVHHRLRKAADQQYVDLPETWFAVRWAEIAAAHGLKATIFLTGRAAVENPEESRALAALPSVEIAGHGWNAFQRNRVIDAFHRLHGTPLGSRGMQRRMVARTCRVLGALTGRPIESWRGFAYCHDVNTPDSLRRAGIRVWSDAVDADATGPVRDASGLVVLPVNTSPANETMFRSRYAVEFTKPGAHRFAGIDAWSDGVRREVERIVAGGGVATVSAHPILMGLLDYWRAYERLCASLAGYQSLWAREVT